MLREASGMAGCRRLVRESLVGAGRCRQVLLVAVLYGGDQAPGP